MNKFRTLGVWMLILIASLFVIGIVGAAAQDSSVLFLTGAPLPLIGGVIYGTKIFNWKGIEALKSLDEKKTAIIGAFQHYVDKILKTPVGGQKMSGPDANLMSAIPVVLVMSDTVKTPDRGYELLFDEIDMRQSTNNTFELIDVTGGVTFYQQAEGEEVKISKIPTSAKTQVAMLRFSGGFNILDDWLRFNQFYKIDQLSADTIRKWFDKRATIFYGLMAALGAGINETFATDDATTINNACAAMLENLAAAGYPVDENSEFVISCTPKLRQRIYKALAASYTAANTNINQILYNIRAVVSTTKLVNTSYYVTLPGGKNQRGEWEDLNARPPQRNELVLGASNIWTGAYNGIIGESKQHRRCALS